MNLPCSSAFPDLVRGPGLDFTAAPFENSSTFVWLNPMSLWIAELPVISGPRKVKEEQLSNWPIHRGANVATFIHIVDSQPPESPLSRTRAGNVSDILTMMMDSMLNLAAG